jgi:hypothetical protein
MRSDCGFEMEVGMTLTSSAGWTSAIVLRLGTATHPPSANGRMMIRGRPTPCSMRARRGVHAVGTRAGRRYTDALTGLLVLCTRSGPEWLTYEGRQMVMLLSERTGR